MQTLDDFLGQINTVETPEQKKARLNQAMLVAGLGLLGTRKGQELPAIGRAGLLGVTQYNQSERDNATERLRQMAARNQAIQAYVQEQKLREQAKYQDAVRGFQPPTARGAAMAQMPDLSPTPQNAAALSAIQAAQPKPGLYEQKLAFAEYLRGKGLPEQALAAEADAEKYAPKYKGLEPVLDPATNKPILVQTYENRPPAPSPYGPKPDIRAVGAGNRTEFVDFLRPPASPITHGTSPDTIYSGGITMRGQNMTDARAREEKGRPQWDATSGQWVSPPTSASPTGVAVSPSGYQKPPRPAPEAYSKQIGGIVNVSTAVENYLDKLRGWSNLDLANPDKLASIGTAYNNTMLQLKEAYNLGVLNGPDYMILTSTLTDPVSLKGAVTSNEAIEKQSTQLRDVLRRNALNLAKVYKQPTDDIEALLAPRGAVKGSSSSTETRPMFVDAKGNRAYRNPDGTYEEVK